MKKIREILLFSLCVLLFSGSLTAAAADGAPIAENLEIMTYRGISVGGQLKAFDPEGEEVHFRITTEPRKGTLTLEENGEFVYTPAEGKRGRDYFGYCASDPKGNLSQEATVVITIRKAGKGAGYADTAGLSCEYAACVLAEEGLFTGRCVCGQYLFEPEETVSCGEFLSLCMETAGIEPVETTVSAESSATAAPVCMLAPVSSWAAAVASYVPDGFPGSRISMFLSQIPWNYYCILTLIMVITISVLNIDYGPMLTHEYNAQVKDDLFTTPERPFEGADDYEEGEKHSSVLDLLLPVIVLIALCIIGLIWTGGVFDPESENYQNFVMAFSDASAGPGLCLGSIVALVFTFIYYWLRGLIGFTKSMESIPNGFIQMISPILILCFAWTLCGLCRDNGLMVGDFVGGIMEGTGSLAKFLPAVIFIVACFIGFATGTSWGTIGIMVPLVCAVFDWYDQSTLLSIGLAASCAGGVCGDHLSPISDTTIMASAGAHCFHLNHVSTQIPYGVTVAAVSFVSFIIAGLVQNVVVCMIIAIVLMIGTLLVIRAVTAKKHKGIFQEMAAANKALAK